MIYFKDVYATFWTAEDKGKYSKGRISTSEKKEYEGETKFENSNWFATFVGKAKDKVAFLEEKDRIKILSGKVTNTMYGEADNKRNYLNVTIFDFEPMSTTKQNEIKSTFEQTDQDQDQDDDDLPF